MYTATLYYRDIKKALRALENLERLNPVIRKEFHKGHIIVTRVPENNRWIASWHVT
jgi:hypothetical protein